MVGKVIELRDMGWRESKMVSDSHGKFSGITVVRNY